MFASRKHTACTLENQTQRGYRDPLNAMKQIRVTPPPIEYFATSLTLYDNFGKRSGTKKSSDLQIATNHSTQINHTVSGKTF
jgi:hypothetical protein